MSTDLRCANCDQLLDVTDKFCRECGLPTLHRAETQRQAAAAPPNADELKWAMDAQPGTTNFAQPVDTAQSQPTGGPDLTTGSVVKVTSPTFAAQMAGSTALMLGLIVVLALIGIGLLVLALKF